MEKTIQKEIHHKNKTEFLFSAYNVRSSHKEKGIPLHIHEEMEIIYFKYGNMEYEVNFETHSLNSEAIIIINKNIPHEVRIKEFTKRECYIFIFNTNMLEGSLNDYSSTKYIFPILDGNLDLPVVLKPEKDKEIFEHLKTNLLNMYNSSMEKKTGYELKIKAALLDSFAHLFQHEYIKIYHDSEKNALKRKKMEKVFCYIKNNYHREVTLEDASDLIGLTESYFSKYFKDYTGYNFVDYLNSYRLSQALQLFNSSDLSVTEVCYETGFQNLSYFIRLFKKKFEVTPGKYKKHYLKG